MEFVQQVAALPLRRNPDDSLSVLLVTSRQTRRWVIPKGWPWPGREDHVAAAEEAREEAPVLGAVHAKSIGWFTYCKRRAEGSIDIRVSVFRLDVTEVLMTWPECEQRERAWFQLAEAALRIEEPELRDLIRGMANQ
jgi:ADP-ribose pyrophosphatase YjhB (NUDIX family)